MFNGNHYVVISSNLKDCLPDSVFEYEAWLKVVVTIANTFERDNPKHFKSDRFMKDCGVK
jgi:hypothetical protein